MTDAKTLTKMDQATLKEWLAKWDAHITRDAKADRYCDKAVGEDIGWHMSPYMDGFYYGYMATKDPSGSTCRSTGPTPWIKRGSKSPTATSAGRHSRRRRDRRRQPR